MAAYEVLEEGWLRKDGEATYVAETPAAARWGARA